LPTTQIALDTGSGDVFAAVANPVRRAMLDALRGGPLAVHDIAAGFDISRPAVSQHLRVLREAHLVFEERAGRERRYRLSAEPLQSVQTWVGEYQDFWPKRLRDLRDVLDAMDSQR
jgi:DNA-binding transcriptional ArsR family regulator